MDSVADEGMGGEKMRYITTYDSYSARGLFGGRIISKKRVSFSGIPRYYGIAYEKHELAAYTIYPKPLHLVARFLNWLDYWTYIPVEKDFEWLK